MSLRNKPAPRYKVIMKRWLYVGVVVAAGLLLGVLNYRAYSPGDTQTVLSQLEFLGHSLHDGGGERMQQIFPEGYVFTWALYGLASAQVAQQLPQDDQRRAALLDRARTAVDCVESQLARSTFPVDLDPQCGAFYFSWSLYLRAKYIRAAGAREVSPGILERFERDCSELAGALDRSPSPFLPSYAEACWPADTCVGIAALSIRDRTLGPKYTAVINRWLEDARQRLDPSLRALSHGADSATGAPADGIRGSSLALMSCVLADVSPEFAAEQYAVLQSHFADYTWGVPGVREYPHGSDGTGDIDSGPVILGFSGPAVVVGAGAARVHGDESLAKALFGTVEAVGFAYEWNGGRRYAIGVIPVGDAFVAWAKSLEPLSGARTTPWKRIVPAWWALPAHAVSLAVMVLMVLRMWYLNRRLEYARQPLPRIVEAQ